MPLVCAARVPALDPNKAFPEFGRQAWLTENGLPQNTVQAITQTSDGYLWIATQEGLGRFNGTSFVIFDKENTPPFKSNDIRALLEDHEGSLWISTSYGLVRMQGGAFSCFTTADGLPDNSIGSLAESSDGSLWIATSAGLARYQNGVFTTLTTREGLAGNNIQALSQVADGELLIGTANGVTRLRNNQVVPSNGLAELKGNSVTTLLQDKSGRLWFGTINGLLSYDQGQWITYTTKNGLPDDRINYLRADSQGCLWVGTAKGLARLRVNGPLSLAVDEGLSSSVILSIFEDREGSVWIGTESDGLNLLRDKKFTTFTTREGLTSNLVKTIYQDKSGQMWIGTNGGGLSALKDGNFKNYTTKDGLSSNVVLSLYGDNGGALWIGSPDGLSQFKNGKFKTFTVAEGLSNDLVRSIYVDRAGNVWVGTRAGLNRFKDGVFTIFTTKDGLANDFIGAIFEDSKGNLWVGTLGGLSKLIDGKFTNLTTKDGLSSDVITSLHEDRDGNLWIGTNGGGLNRLRDGHLVSYATGNGLPEVIYRILEDHQQNLWLSSPKGIFKLSSRALNDFAEGKIQTLDPVAYGPSDGMLTRECSGGGYPAGWQSSEGKLWFSTIKGVAVIDPAKIPVNKLPPPIAIEQIRIDDQPVALAERVELPPGRTRFEFYYAALSFIAPENVRFKYKLEGFDHDWVEGGSRRAAYYTNLPHGKYKFRVIASNNDGIWNKQGAGFEFYLRPHFYQTYWFLGLCGLLVAASIWQLYRMRVKQMASQFGAVLGERNRIAREIHDNLAQDILGISVQLELVARLMPIGAEKAKGPLDRARLLVRNSMAEMRRYVWDLRSQILEKKDLPTALSDTARRLTGDTPIQAQVQVQGTFRPLAPLVESNLLRIGQEAINNAVKHAQAGRIFINLNFDAKGVQLSVRDDGRGFDAQARGRNGDSEHFGLVGMRERAEQIGALLRIQSNPESGTEVLVDVPIAG